IVISSKRNDRGKYVIYAGDRRTSAHEALVKRGLSEFKKIRSKKLLNDDDKRAVRREVYGTNNDRDNWAEEDLVEILSLEYPKERFMQKLAGAPTIGKEKIIPLADEIAEDWVMSKRTAYRYIKRVIESKGWTREKKKAPYPLLGTNEFKSASIRAKEYIAAEKKLTAAQKAIDDVWKDVLDPKTKILNKNEFLAFVEDFKKGKARHL
ncbi:chromosome partitioning protein ParB, partial [Leptospira stimsonii]